MNKLPSSPGGFLVIVIFGVGLVTMLSMAVVFAAKLVQWTFSNPMANAIAAGVPWLVDGFEHEALSDALSGIEGFALVSYTGRPEGLYPDWLELSREFGHDAGNRTGHSKEVTERLLCNFDPGEVPKFSPAAQSSLSEVGQA